MAFDQINEALTDYPELDSASFLQGMLSGLLCGDADLKVTAWVKRILVEADVKTVKESFLVLLHQMHLNVDAGLNGSGFEFELLLPDDQESLSFRAAMLGQWTEGFLYGLGLTGQSAQKMNKEISELLNDFSDISRIEMDGLESLEAEEREQAELDLVQLIEYVKVGVLTINETLNPLEGSPIVTDEPPTQTLH